MLLSVPFAPGESRQVNDCTTTLESEESNTGTPVQLLTSQEGVDASVRTTSQERVDASVCTTSQERVDASVHTTSQERVDASVCALSGEPAHDTESKTVRAGGGSLVGGREGENQGSRVTEMTAADPVCLTTEPDHQHVGGKLLAEAGEPPEPHKNSGHTSSKLLREAGETPELLKSSSRTAGTDSTQPEVHECHREHPQVSPTDPGGLAVRVKEELEALSSPCNAVFECTLTLERCKSLPAKRTKGKETERKWELLLSFEWIQGDNKDSLHQITQFLKNKMQQDKLI